MSLEELMNASSDEKRDPGKSKGPVPVGQNKYLYLPEKGLELCANLIATSTSPGKRHEILDRLNRIVGKRLFGLAKRRSEPDRRGNVPQADRSASGTERKSQFPEPGAVLYSRSRRNVQRRQVKVSQFRSRLSVAAAHGHNPDHIDPHLHRQGGVRFDLRIELLSEKNRNRRRSLESHLPCLQRQIPGDLRPSAATDLHRKKRFQVSVADIFGHSGIQQIRRLSEFQYRRGHRQGASPGAPTI